MPLPTEGPTTEAAVKLWLRIPAGDDRDNDTVETVVAAVNELVRGLPVVQSSDVDPAPEAFPAGVVLGATMLAARMVRRQNTPGGVEVAGEFGIAYVRRNDPDVAQLLELGEYGKPAVG